MNPDEAMQAIVDDVPLDDGDRKLIRTQLENVAKAARREGLRAAADKFNAEAEHVWWHYQRATIVDSLRRMAEEVT